MYVEEPRIEWEPHERPAAAALRRIESAALCEDCGYRVRPAAFVARGVCDTCDAIRKTRRAGVLAAALEGAA